MAKSPMEAWLTVLTHLTVERFINLKQWPTITGASTRVNAILRACPFVFFVGYDKGTGSLSWADPELPKTRRGSK